MQKHAVTFLALLAAAAFADSTQAQQAVPGGPFSVEVRGGLALPTGDLDDIAETGYTFGFGGVYRFTPMFSAYAGFSYNGFSADEEAAGFDDPNFDADINLYGGNAGLQADFTAGNLAPFLRAGVVYYESEVSGGDDDARVTLSAGSEPGFQAGGGLVFPLGPRVSVVPAATYTDVDEASWVALDVGLRIRI